MEELIRILLKWLKPIGIVCAIAAVGSAAISLLLPNYYLSKTVFLPSNPHYMEPNNLYATETGGQPVYLFGGPTDMYRLLALSESRELQDYVIEKYNLYDYWEIDKDAKFAEFKIRERFAKYIKTYQTPNGMMQSEVSDTDPQLAATICNDILGYLDSMNKRVFTEKMKDKLAYFKNDEIQRKQKMQMFKDSLVQIIEKTPKDTITHNILEKLMLTAMGQYNVSNMIYEQQKKALEQEYSTIYVIEPAVPPTRKSSPKRSLIVLTAVLISLGVMIFVAVFIEKFKEVSFTKNQ